MQNGNIKVAYTKLTPIYELSMFIFEASTYTGINTIMTGTPVKATVKLNKIMLKLPGQAKLIKL
jgi:hypothetical protein